MIIYLDMDGVLADFFAGLGRVVSPDEDPTEIYEKGFYRNLPVMEGAKEAVAKLLAHPDLKIYIASKPCNTRKNPHCPSEKYEWIDEHFPELYNKIYLTCNKNRLTGNFLIDDHPHKWNKFEGTVIKFDPKEPVESWKKVLSIFNI